MLGSISDRCVVSVAVVLAVPGAEGGAMQVSL